ncbi:MAG: ribonuclease HIII [Candidatus Zixiibacteriota bacterium]
MPINKSEKILGIDESGKGDFFGPLVIAGVVANNEECIRIEAEGIRDSKKISDNVILKLSDWIKKNFVHSIVIVGPEKYNELYSKIRNLNKLLAWGHSRVIENIASENQIDLAISDKFGKDELIRNALMKNGKEVKLNQMVRGEAMIPVAAASIVARAAFVQQMKKMSDLYQIEFLKGASAKVDETAYKFAVQYGKEALEKVAKLHFKNYQKALSGNFSLF